MNIKKSYLINIYNFHFLFILIIVVWTYSLQENYYFELLLLFWLEGTFI